MERAKGNPGREEQTVGYHMQRTVITIQSTELLLNAYQTMQTYRIGCLPVLRGEEVVGIATDRMLLQHAVNRLPLTTPIGAISAPPLTIGPEETTPHAIEKLRGNHSRYLLVTNGQGGLKG